MIMIEEIIMLNDENKKIITILLIADIKESEMDLSKVQKFKHQINLDISDSDVMKVLNLRGSIASKHFFDSKACLDIFPNFYDDIASFHVGHLVEDDGRRFFNFLQSSQMECSYKGTFGILRLFLL